MTPTRDGGRREPEHATIPWRRVPHERALGVGFRTVHLMAFGVLLGGHAFAVEPGRLLPALWATLLSGAALMALEVYKTPHWLAMGKGVAVLAKLLLLLLVPVWWEARVPLLLAVVVVASVGAHMPARYRHYSLLRRRLLDPAVLDVEVDRSASRPTRGRDAPTA